MKRILTFLLFLYFNSILLGQTEVGTTVVASGYTRLSFSCTNDLYSGDYKYDQSKGYWLRAKDNIVSSLIRKNTNANRWELVVKFDEDPIDYIQFVSDGDMKAIIPPFGTWSSTLAGCSSLTIGPKIYTCKVNTPTNTSFWQDATWTPSYPGKIIPLGSICILENGFIRTRTAGDNIEIYGTLELNLSQLNGFNIINHGLIINSTSEAFLPTDVDNYGTIKSGSLFNAGGNFNNRRSGKIYINSSSVSFDESLSYDDPALPDVNNEGYIQIGNESESGAGIGFGLGLGAPRKLTNSGVINFFHCNTSFSGNNYRYPRVKTQISNSGSINCPGKTYYFDEEPFKDCPCGSSVNCQPPINVSIGSITTTEAKVEWGAVPNAAAYVLEYKLSSSADWTTVSNISANDRVIDNLEANTLYDVRISSVCAAGAKTSSPSLVYGFKTKKNWGQVKNVRVSLANSDLEEIPLPDAEVTLYDKNNIAVETVQTNTQGEFSFAANYTKDVEEGSTNYKIKVVKGDLETVIFKMNWEECQYGDCKIKLPENLLKQIEARMTLVQSQQISIVNRQKSLIGYQFNSEKTSLEPFKKGWYVSKESDYSKIHALGRVYLLNYMLQKDFVKRERYANIQAKKLG